MAAVRMRKQKCLNQNQNTIKNSCRNNEKIIHMLPYIPLTAAEGVKRNEPCGYPCLSISRVKIGVYSHDVELYLNVFLK